MEDVPPPERLIQQEILLAKARALRNTGAEMAAKMDSLAKSRERQLRFMLRLAQRELRRQQKFLVDMEYRLNDVIKETE